MSNENDEIELSPGFFDLNNENEMDDEISKLVPDKIDVENDNNVDKDDNNDDNDDNNDDNDDDNKNKNVMIEFLYVMTFNTKRSCACGDGAWTRIRTY